MSAQGDGHLCRCLPGEENLALFRALQAKHGALCGAVQLLVLGHQFFYALSGILLRQIFVKGLGGGKLLQLIYLLSPHQNGCQHDFFILCAAVGIADGQLADGQRKDLIQRLGQFTIHK